MTKIMNTVTFCIECVYIYKIECIITIKLRPLSYYVNLDFLEYTQPWRQNKLIRKKCC